MYLQQMSQAMWVIMHRIDIRLNIENSKKKIKAVSIKIMFRRDTIQKGLRILFMQFFLIYLNQRGQDCYAFRLTTFGSTYGPEEPSAPAKSNSKTLKQMLIKYTQRTIVGNALVSLNNCEFKAIFPKEQKMVTTYKHLIVWHIEVKNFPWYLKVFIISQMLKQFRQEPAIVLEIVSALSLNSFFTVSKYGFSLLKNLRSWTSFITISKSSKEAMMQRMMLQLSEQSVLSCVPIKILSLQMMIKKQIIRIEAIVRDFFIWHLKDGMFRFIRLIFYWFQGLQRVYDSLYSCYQLKFCIVQILQTYEILSQNTILQKYHVSLVMSNSLLLVRPPLFEKLVVNFASLHAIDQVLTVLQAQRILHLLFHLYFLQTVVVVVSDNAHLFVDFWPSSLEHERHRLLYRLFGVVQLKRVTFGEGQAQIADLMLVLLEHCVHVKGPLLEKNTFIFLLSLMYFLSLELGMHRVDFLRICALFDRIILNALCFHPSLRSLFRIMMGSCSLVHKLKQLLPISAYLLIDLADVLHLADQDLF